MIVVSPATTQYAAKHQMVGHGYELQRSAWIVAILVLSEGGLLHSSFLPCLCFQMSVPAALIQELNLNKKHIKSKSVRKALAVARTCLQALDVVAGVVPILGPQIQSIVNIAVSILSLVEVRLDFQSVQYWAYRWMVCLEHWCLEDGEIRFSRKGRFCAQSCRDYSMWIGRTYCTRLDYWHIRIWSVSKLSLVLCALCSYSYSWLIS